MLINDSIYLLDESLTKIARVKQLTSESEESTYTTRFSEVRKHVFDSARYSKEPETHSFSCAVQNDRRERAEEMERTERQVRTYMLLAKESIRMLHLLARDYASYFMRDELSDRLATMLNYFMSQLAGPQNLELKVKNPAKYNFEPKWLLKKIANIYLYFYRANAEFAAAIGRDGRSYSHDTFLKAGNILERENLLPQVRSFIIRLVPDTSDIAICFS
jgi:ubiquitin conjugation factor E4 B